MVVPRCARARNGWQRVLAGLLVGQPRRCPRPVDAFLFKPNPISELVRDEFFIELGFGRREIVEAGSRGSIFAPPPLAMCQESLAVHQRRPGLREMSSEPVENREAVAVDVSPIDHLGVCEPRHLSDVTEAAFSRAGVAS